MESELEEDNLHLVHVDALFLPCDEERGEGGMSRDCSAQSFCDGVNGMWHLAAESGWAWFSSVGWVKASDLSSTVLSHVGPYVRLETTPPGYVPAVPFSVSSTNLVLCLKTSLFRLNRSFHASLSSVKATWFNDWMLISCSVFGAGAGTGDIHTQTHVSLFGSLLFLTQIDDRWSGGVCPICPVDCRNGLRTEASKGIVELWRLTTGRDETRPPAVAGADGSRLPSSHQYKMPVHSERTSSIGNIFLTLNTNIYFCSCWTWQMCVGLRSQYSTSK